jgi:hypothetical protein
MSSDVEHFYVQRSEPLSSLLPCYDPRAGRAIAWSGGERVEPRPTGS